MSLDDRRQGERITVQCDPPAAQAHFVAAARLLKRPQGGGGANEEVPAQADSLNAAAAPRQAVFPLDGPPVTRYVLLVELQRRAEAAPDLGVFIEVWPDEAPRGEGRAELVQFQPGGPDYLSAQFDITVRR